MLGLTQTEYLIRTHHLSAISVLLDGALVLTGGNPCMPNCRESSHCHKFHRIRLPLSTEKKYNLSESKIQNPLL